MPLIQVVVTALLFTYACIWRMHQAKRRSRSWEELITCLQLDYVAIEPAEEEGVEDLWARIGGARGLWAIYRQVPQLVAIADYAEHDGNLDEGLLCSLRTEALQLRTSVLATLVEYALTRSKLSASEHMNSSIASYREVLTMVSQIAAAHPVIAAPAVS